MTLQTQSETTMVQSEAAPRKGAKKEVEVNPNVVVPTKGLKFDTTSELPFEPMNKESTASDDDGDMSVESGEDPSNSASSVPPPQIASKENTQVLYAKRLVMFVLIAATVTVGVLTYWYVSENEQEDFLQQFENDATELVEASNANGESTMNMLEIFATMLSSSARQMAVDGVSPWPFYTLPDFEKLGSASRSISGTQVLAFAPVVANTSRAQWEKYSVENQWWIDEGLEDLGIDTEDVQKENITEYIFNITEDGKVPDKNVPEYSPIWQTSPAPVDTSGINYNIRNFPAFLRLVNHVERAKTAAISEVLDAAEFFDTTASETTLENKPESLAVLPVFEIPQSRRTKIVGHLIAIIEWSQVFSNILQEGHSGVIVILEAFCGEFSTTTTFEVNGPDVLYVGDGDLHDSAYDSESQSTEYVGYKGKGSNSTTSSHCQYVISAYPSKKYEESCKTSSPIFFTAAVVMVFAFTSAVFAIYDWYVAKRQHKVNNVAVQSNAIVANLFPAQVRDKLFHGDDEGRSSVVKKDRFQRSSHTETTSDFSQSYDRSIHLHALNEEMGLDSSQPPIADLFPSATVLFMDIAGFTAWSSQREPSQVFILLETIYRTFDRLAKHRRVFKVETIGDCYLAVCGVPDACDDHAVIMARFARDCLEKMNTLVYKLETTLGPDTAELGMRAGLHSGPVTAGVLRGERARFQLFGDTVNTASRMESTGVMKRVQVSQQTADLLIAANKGGWLRARQDKVFAKGKGELQTYWLLPKRDSALSQSTPSGSDNTSEFDAEMKSIEIPKVAIIKPVSLGRFQPIVKPPNSERVQRLINWTSEMLLQILKKIAMKRAVEKARTPKETSRIQNLEASIGKTGRPLDEVSEVIEFPAVVSTSNETEKVELSPDVVSQLHSFVAAIAAMYRRNPFHNFDHASHVAQSVSKLLSRVASGTNNIPGTTENAYEHPCGITNDPLTQFAIVFSSLIHDVDHQGVPNNLLIKENPEMAHRYQNQAVAEQHSIDVAWNLLMDPAYEALRRAIYNSETELKRFRQLVVNALMATDIFDPQLARLRKERWDRAFFQSHPDEGPIVSSNRKQTIVIEYIIQASDVSHTMQHWHVYSKWNKNLYQEMFNAYCQGRSDQDPTDGWFQGELRFFDNYVIPLALKLKECGVFGVSSDECLQYAMANRSEWERKGRTIVKELYEMYNEQSQNSENTHSHVVAKL